MHIAYICADPGVPVFGTKGSSVHVQAVIRAFRTRGARVTLLASRYAAAPPPDLADLPCLALPRPPKGEPAEREAALLNANQALAATLAELGPVDLIYERYSLWSYAGMEHAANHGVPGLLEVNAPLIVEQARHRTLVDRAGAEGVARRAFAAASALLAVSEGVAAYLRSRPGPTGPIHVVPNGVDPRPYLGRRPGQDGQNFTVGFVGTLKPWHGLDTLLAAFALLREQVPAARLLIVGDGPERAACEATIAHLGLDDAVELTGAVAPDAVPALLALMDVATAPYPAMDDCYYSPLKLFEYMAAGLPIVASRIGQVAEVIEHGRSGLLCRPGDPVALAGSLARLERDAGLRARLGAVARASVLREHTWDRVAERIFALAMAAPQELSAHA